METKAMRIFIKVIIFGVLFIFNTLVGAAYFEKKDFNSVKDIKSLYVLPSDYSKNGNHKCNKSIANYKIYNLNFNICYDKYSEVDRIPVSAITSRDMLQAQTNESFYRLKSDALSLILFKKNNYFSSFKDGEYKVDYEYMKKAFYSNPDLIKNRSTVYNKDLVLFKLANIPESVINIYKIEGKKYKGFVIENKGKEGEINVHIFNNKNWIHIFSKKINGNLDDIISIVKRMDE